LKKSVIEKKKPAVKKTAVKKTAPAEAAIFENPLIPNARLKLMYQSMVQCRLIGEVTSAKLAGSEPALGDEASLATMALELDTGDTVAAARKGLVLQLVREMKLAQDAKSAKPAGKPLALLHEIVAPGDPGASGFDREIEAATEFAKENRKRKKRKISLLYADESWTLSAAWHEAVEAAGKLGLPMVFVCERDANDEKTSDPVVSFPVIHVDGNDAVAVYRVAQESMYRARSGSGPTMVVSRTYRWHQKQPMQEKDPILRMQKYLESKRLYDLSWANQLSENFKRELAAAASMHDPEAAE
jgi:TPP-dependent pyruvate/acetoin dehydrogenase alpha subunit